MELIWAGVGVAMIVWAFMILMKLLSRMVVALNEHWQCVGGMAARTVVVDTKER